MARFVFAFVMLLSFLALSQEECLILDDFLKSENWTSAESTMTSGVMEDQHPTVIFHVDIDHSAGQQGYPIGWPRAYSKIARKIHWKEYDRIEFRIFTTISGGKFPANGLNLIFRDEANISCSYPLGEHNGIKLGDWSTISIPMKAFAKLGVIKEVGIYINEKDYQDHSVLECKIGHFKLARSSICSISEMICGYVQFTGEISTLEVKMTVEGAVAARIAAVPFDVCRNEELLRREALPVPGGTSVLSMDLTELCLTDGEYLLIAYPDHNEMEKSCVFRVQGSPWKEEQ